MDIITSTPGLFHIAKKIISILTRSHPVNVDSIKNLRLTNVGWKSIIESEDMFKLWHKLYLSRQDDFPEQTFDLISTLYKKAYNGHDRKLSWLLSLRPRAMDDLEDWSIEHVIAYITDLDPNLGPYVQEFRRHGIDGAAFKLLTPEIIITYTDIRLGPALRICNIANKVQGKDHQSIPEKD